MNVVNYLSRVTWSKLEIVLDKHEPENINHTLHPQPHYRPEKVPSYLAKIGWCNVLKNMVKLIGWNMHVSLYETVRVCIDSLTFLLIYFVREWKHVLLFVRALEYLCWSIIFHLEWAIVILYLDLQMIVIIWALFSIIEVFIVDIFLN